MSTFFPAARRGLLAAVAASFGLAAQGAETIVITGNPLANDSPLQPSNVLAGDGLTLRRAGTLGETLAGLPGVASSWFGPNASRPVIRGLDGDRVRLLDNGGASVDASNLSFDHAPAIDPLAVERLEVLRGPAALLYGGNATGGVVNSIDNRIPRSVAPGLSGRSEVRLGGAADERSAATVLELGSGSFGWHADAFGRRTADLRVPEYTPVVDGEALASTKRVRNSAAESSGGAVGGSWIGRDGFFGLAVDTLNNDYGTVAEADVQIRMKRNRVAAAGEARNLGGWLPQVGLQASHTDYEHREIEGGQLGTTFRSRGSDLRLDAHHADLGPLRGVFGLQSEQLRFSALGEEAFVPSTETRSNALFAVEEARLGAVTLSAGLRREQVSVASDGDAPDAAEARFGAATERRFTPTSGSFGADWAAGGGWRFSASLGHTERAPAYYELFANGLHVATAAFERGDPTLGPERSRHVELGAAWVQDASSVKLNVFDTRFARFIALEASGASVSTDEGEVPEYRFRGVRARLRGAELDGRWRVATAPWQVDLTGGLDLVRGDDLDSGEPLPRLAPLRLRSGVEGGSGPWRLGLGVQHAARQERVPATDSATPSSTIANLWASWTTVLGGSEAMAYLKLDNATNALAYNAASTPTLRALAPLPGRSVAAGLRLRY